MKILKNWKSFNEAKTKIVNFSDLDENWSSNYYISEDISKIKKDYKKLGRNGSIDKVIKIVNKIGKKDYNEAVKYAKSIFNINITKFESAKKESYWNGHFSSISTLIVILGSLEGSINKSKEKIQKDIADMEKRLDTLSEIQ